MASNKSFLDFDSSFIFRPKINNEATSKLLREYVIEKETKDASFLKEWKAMKNCKY